MNFELIKSLQRLASTMAGESSLAASERMSIGSKLKESKLSATSFGTLDNSHSSRHLHAKLHKIKSESEFKSYNEAKKLQ